MMCLRHDRSKPRRVTRIGDRFLAKFTPRDFCTGMMAHSKGKSLGIYEDKEKSEEELEARKKHDAEMGVEKIDVFGLKVRWGRGGCKFGPKAHWGLKRSSSFSFALLLTLLLASNVSICQSALSAHSAHGVRPSFCVVSPSFSILNTMLGRCRQCASPHMT